MLSKNKRFFFFQWIGGFLLWLIFDLLMEAFVFEWLAWNGTTKNDWFFVGWWIGVFSWLGWGMTRLLGSGPSEEGG